MEYVAIFEGLAIALFCMMLVHGVRRYDVKRLVLAFTLIGAVVTIEENCVMLLTQDYTYIGYHLWIGQFPVAIMLGWIVVAYISFLIATRVNNVVLGACTATLLDLVAEPIAYTYGLWIWYNTMRSPICYFNAPIGNIIGWFLLTLLGTTILKVVISYGRLGRVQA